MKSPALALALLLAGAPAHAAEPAIVRVRIETSMGPITIALDHAHAPKTVENFLAYVDDGRLEGTTFYRAARSKLQPDTGFIQGGIDTDVRRKLPPVPFESTDRTGLHHVDGAISMARGEEVDLAYCNFSLMLGAHPGLDARPGSPGYAVFGHLVGDRATVKRILALPTGGGVGPMRGQMILRPVTILRAVRLDGTPKPTGRLKVWLIALPKAKPRP